jgi:hypothetical protein
MRELPAIAIALHPGIYVLYRPKPSVAGNRFFISWPHHLQSFIAASTHFPLAVYLQVFIQRQFTRALPVTAAVNDV